tara:strand:- start:190 stop:507 length:318 start_codon:yes stop_codon:yes gene_type:complete
MSKSNYIKELKYLYKNENDQAKDRNKMKHRELLIKDRIIKNNKYELYKKLKIIQYLTYIVFYLFCSNVYMALFKLNFMNFITFFLFNTTTFIGIIIYHILYNKYK